MIDLTSIQDPSFVKRLSKKELKELAKEIRQFLIEHISKTGGHLSSNLGIVEITLAMYYVFDYDQDQFIFDVGHQSYVHKILTGRAKDFDTLRQYQGLSGYICKEESKYDVWESGHSSTSLSAMAGMLLSKENKDQRIISLIGDSSIMNGVAFEGLNFLGNQNQLAPIIILNDNKMGISKSVGALAKTLSRLRGTHFWRTVKRVLNTIFPTFVCNWFHQLKRGIKGMIQHDNIFEDMGFDYYGPIKGNDLYACIKALKRIEHTTQPVILHILTKKGKGYAPSEADESGNYHGIGPFDIASGKPLQTLKPHEASFSKIVADYLVEKRKEEPFFVVTPAMKSGAKLEEFATLYPTSFYDVGIAEEHAAIMAAGIALNHQKVVLLYYSTFMQRAYDEILNDIARQNLSVIIGIDRAGVVGEDGATHQGIYDIAMLSSMPNMLIAMPKDLEETIGIFNYAFLHEGPIAIRYPRKIIDTSRSVDRKKIIPPSWDELLEGEVLCILAYGPDVDKIKEILTANSLSVGLVNARYIQPLDSKILEKICKRYRHLLIIEQVVHEGSLYSLVLAHLNERRRYLPIDFVAFDKNRSITHGSIEEVLDHYGMSEEDILKKINGILSLYSTEKD